MKERRLLSILLATIILIGLVKILDNQSSNTGSGMWFTQKRMYSTNKNIGAAPKSYEAVIKIPSLVTESAGVIVGNYFGSTNSFSLEIVSKKPMLRITNEKGNFEVYFDSVPDLNTDEWLHLAIIHEKTNSIKCYINGTLKQTITSTNVPYVTDTGPMVLGGDHRYSLGKSNTQYFRGCIQSIVLYNDARTPAEIKSDIKERYGTDLMLRYDIRNLSQSIEKVSDLSGNEFHAYFEHWIKREEMAKDSYDFSFAVIGDTQGINNSIAGRQYLDKIYDWIINNVENKKIEYVFGLGDITEHQTMSEYAHATQNIQKLNGLVPYVLVRGNHDNGKEAFTNHFDYKEYTSQIGGRYKKSSLNNVWMEFTIDNIPYLVLALDYSPSASILDWACSVVEEHPQHNVILVTHAYLYRDGSRLNKSGNKLVVPENDGDFIWEHLGKKYANIIMILSGHDPTNEIVISTAKGVHGNTVAQILIDAQNMDNNFMDLGMQPAGMIAMFYISDGGKTLSIDYYSTVRDAYWGETKRITLDLKKT